MGERRSSAAFDDLLQNRPTLRLHRAHAGFRQEPNALVLREAVALSSSNIANPLLDPTLELFDVNGTSLDSNDNWKDGQPQAVSAIELAPADDRESVIVAFLPPGNYTAVVRGKADTTGVALVETYRIP